MIKKIIVLFGLMAIVNIVQASENLFQPRFGVGIGSYEFKNLDDDTDEPRTASYTLVELGGTYIWSKWYVDLAFQGSADTTVDDADHIDFKRSDGALSVGRMFSSNGSIFFGISSQTDKSTNNIADIEVTYQSAGLHGGLSYGWLIGNSTSIAFSGALAGGGSISKIKNLSGDGEVELEGDSVGASVSLKLSHYFGKYAGIAIKLAGRSTIHTKRESSDGLLSGDDVQGAAGSLLFTWFATI